MTAGGPTPVVGGRLQGHATRWKELDQWAGKLVEEGLRLGVTGEPTARPREFSGSSEHERIVERTHREFVEKGAVEPVPAGEHGAGAYALLFPVPKKGGKWRGVLDLRQLNESIKKDHFKMEGLHTVKETLRPGDWMTSLDIQDAYLHIPVHPEDRKYLRYRHQGQDYQFTCMPFGITLAPRIFTKLMRPVVAELRRRGIRCVIYLDDLLIMAPTRRQAEEQTREARDYLESLGWLLNLNKSELTPARVITYLGFQFDSENMTVLVPTQKVRDLKRDLQTTLLAAEHRVLTLRQLAGVMGKIAATGGAVAVTKLLTRALMREKNALLKTRSWDQVVDLSPEARNELKGWQDFILSYNGREIIMPEPEIVITTDASPWGWGAHTSTGVTVQGAWSSDWVLKHNNLQELEAISRAVRSLAGSAKEIKVMTDNLVAMWYMNNQGGRYADLSRIAQDLWGWALQRGKRIVADYIPGKENVKADKLSRDRYDWSLKEPLFARLERRWGPHTVDLFASEATTKTEAFWTWTPSAAASGRDAMTVTTLAQGNAYAFPPVAMIARLLRRVQLQRATITLVAPYWPTQAWWPTLVAMLVAKPLRLGPAPLQQAPPGFDPSLFRLTAFRLSGDPRRSAAYRRRLSS